MRGEVLPFDEAVAGPGVERVAGAIRRGEIIAYPAETMYGLGGDGLDWEVAEVLRRIKGSPPGRAFLLLLDERDRWSQVASSFPPAALRLARLHWPGPLTLLLPALPGVAATGSEGKVAVRVPAFLPLRGWIEAAGRPLFSTSANRAGEEPVRTPAGLLERFGGEADLLIPGPDFPEGGLPSTIVDASSGSLRLVRPGALRIDELDNRR